MSKNQRESQKKMSKSQLESQTEKSKSQKVKNTKSLLSKSNSETFSKCFTYRIFRVPDLIYLCSHTKPY